MINIRRAKPNEYEILSNIAAESESYWGYDLEYMNSFKLFYSVSEDFINEYPTAVIEKNKELIGFYGVLIGEDEISLEYFFIEPDYIGQGYGKLLWNYLINDCRSKGIARFSIVTSPQAKDFYIKMGALFYRQVESLLRKGRIIPKLIYTVR